MARRIWKDRVIEKPRTYNLQNNPDGSVTLIPNTGVVVEEGTPVNALNLNGLEEDLETHKDNNAMHGQVIKGRWNDISTQIAPSGTYTKTIPLGFNAKKGRLIQAVTGLNSGGGGIVFFSTDPLDAMSFCKTVTSYSFLTKLLYGSVTDPTFGKSGSVWTINLFDAYVEGNNLILIFKNTSASVIGTLLVDLYWEVES